MSMEIIKGKSILNKVAIGPILYHRKTESQVKRRTVEDTEAEVKRYEMAVACAEDELKTLHEKACEQVGETGAAVFEVHMMILEDADYRDSVLNIIRNQKTNAEYAAAVSIGMVLAGPVGKLTAGIFVILGHMFPLYFGFKGGKGVLVGAVMLAFFDWRVFGIAFVLFLLSVIVTKWISLGSILGAVSFPITTWVFYRDPVLTAMALGMAAVVVFMHRSNIGRIIRGKENKFSIKSKKTMSD